VGIVGVVNPQQARYNGPCRSNRDHEGIIIYKYRCGSVRCGRNLELKRRIGGMIPRRIGDVECEEVRNNVANGFVVRDPIVVDIVLGKAFGRGESQPVVGGQAHERRDIAHTGQRFFRAQQCNPLHHRLDGNYPCARPHPVCIQVSQHNLPSSSHSGKINVDLDRFRGDIYRLIDDRRGSGIVFCDQNT